ncbi:MAG: hypothetical protein FWG74_09940 [Planctomycetes bacterium]|nr:hypothetical protein [Planctomycetota bacterium]
MSDRNENLNLAAMLLVNDYGLRPAETAAQVLTSGRAQVLGRFFGLPTADDPGISDFFETREMENQP